MAIDTALENLKKESKSQLKYHEREFMKYAEEDMDDFILCHRWCIINHDCGSDDECEYEWRSSQHERLYDAWMELKDVEALEYKAALAR